MGIEPEIMELVNTFTHEVLPFLIDLLKEIIKVVKWLVDAFSDAWEWIKQAWSDLSDFFSNFWENLKQGAHDAWEGIKKPFKAAAQWFSDVFQKVKDVVKAPINFVIRGLNKMISGLNKISFDIPDWVPLIGGKHFGFNIGLIPELARGGILKKGQAGFLEGTGAEAVVPLDNNKRWISAVAKDMLSALTKAAGTSVSNLTNNTANTTNFTQIINAPKQPSRIDLYRQTRNLLSYAEAVKGVS